MSNIYYRHEGYGHGGRRKMVRHRVKDASGVHLVETACGKFLDRSLTTREADIAPWQGEKKNCRRCFKGAEEYGLSSDVVKT